MSNPERFSEVSIDKNTFLRACNAFGSDELEYVNSQIPLRRIESAKAFIEELQGLPYDHSEGPYGLFQFEDEPERDTVPLAFVLSNNFQTQRSIEYGDRNGYTLMGADHSSITLRKDDDEQYAEQGDTIRLIAYIYRSGADVQIHKSQDRTKEELRPSLVDIDVIKYFINKMGR